MDNFLQFGVPALIGLIAGVIGSLVAPWVHWGIEKRRVRLEDRRKLIADARAEIQHTALQQDPDKRDFRGTVLYSRLRDYLSEQTRKEIESDGITVQIVGRGAGVNNYIPRVLDEIRRLEKTWGLL